MKIKKEDYEILKNAINNALLKYSDIPNNYKRLGFSDKRLRWDLLRYSQLKYWGDNKGIITELNLYSYLNDEHIDTALRNIMNNINN